MKTKYWIYAAAFIILLVALTTHSVSSVSASGNSLPELEGTPPPPSPPPDPGTPEPSGDDDDGGGEKKNIFKNIWNIIFDYRTMKDAIISTISGMFEDGVADIASEGTELYGLGAEISKIVFPDPEQIKSANQLSMKGVRQSTWREMRKVAFALLPLVAALTIWASMKEGLYSVTGYANTLEAVTELVVSIAIALASYFLMEQAISLTSTLAEAIGDAFQYNIKLSVLAGALIKPVNFQNSAPILAMILYIFALVFLVVLMGSVFIAFLAREVVLVMVVGMAPLMMILGAVRPLGWLRALWTKAFFVVLLILPINVLLLGISVKLQVIAADLTTGLAGTIFYLLIVVGIISILIAVNSALGKLVYSAAIEVAQKIGSAIQDVVSIGAVIGGAALGAGGFSALLGGAGGTAGAMGLAGGGGSSGGGMLANTVSSGGDITQTGNLTKVIGTALSGSRSKVLSGFGRGLSAGDNIKDQQQKQLQQSQRSLPPIDIENKGMPGYEEGIEDVKNLYQGDSASVPKLAEENILDDRVDQGGSTIQATIRAAEVDKVSGRLVYEELGVNRTNLATAGREVIQKEVGTAVLGKHSPYMAHDINYQSPATPGPHARDYAVSFRMALNDQKHHGSIYRDPDPQMMGDVARAVRVSRQSGMHWTEDIMDEASSQGLQNWVDDKLGNI